MFNLLHSGLVLALLCSSGVLHGATATNVFPKFEEVFAGALGDAWCEQNRLSTVDVDRDGRTDIVAMVTGLVSPFGPPWQYRSRVMLLHALPEGGFESSIIADFPGDYGYGARAGDLNNDGWPDLVIRAWLKTHILLNDGTGKFLSRGTVPTGFYLGSPVDVNRDGHLDLISGTQTESGGMVELFLNDGTGTNFVKSWQSRLYEGRLHSVETVLSVNLNGDEFMDLAAREIYGGRLITFLGSASANAFAEQEVLDLGSRVFGLASGRVNGDAFDDLVVDTGSVQVFVTQTNGTLKPLWTGPDLGSIAYNLALADFDGDGFDDLFVGTFDDGRLRIFHNDAGNSFSPWWEDGMPGEGYSGAVADLNSDGWPDLILSERNDALRVSHLRVWMNRTGLVRILRVVQANDGARVTWTTRPSKRYRLQFKTRLEDAWSNAAEATASGWTLTLVDPTSNQPAQRFYRVEELP